MIFEVAILPDSFDEENNPSMLIGTLKDILNTGVLIADFQTGNWSKVIQTSYVNNYAAQSLKDKVLALIRQLKDRKKIVKLTNYSHIIETENDWLQVVKKHNETASLELAIAGNTTYLECENTISSKCVCINEVLANDRWEELKKQDGIGTKTSSYFNDVLEKLFNHANIIKLVDPYLTPNGQSKSIIKICINNLKKKKNFMQGSGRIEIHTKADTSISIEANFSRWNSIFESINNIPSHSFKVCLWKDNSPVDKFHDRFILTNSHGMSITHSFDLKDDSEQEVTFNLLSKDTFETHINNFSEEDPKFQLEAERVYNV